MMKLRLKVMTTVCVGTLSQFREKKRHRESLKLFHEEAGVKNGNCITKSYCFGVCDKMMQWS